MTFHGGVAIAIDKKPYPFDFDTLGLVSGSLAKLVILAPPISNID